MKWGLLLFFVVTLVGCGERQPTTEETMRKDLDYQETRMQDLSDRVRVLEKSNKFADEVKKKEDAENLRAEQEAKHLESLRSDQRQIDGAQKLLCDASHDC